MTKQDKKRIAKDNVGQDANISELDPTDCSHNLCPNGRTANLQKLNPFSVESLLSDSTPRRKPNLDFPTLPVPRPLIGKGHFLLYPITQPLGFIVPQTALKTGPGPDTLNMVHRGLSANNSTQSHFTMSNTGNISTDKNNHDSNKVGQQRIHRQRTGQFSQNRGEFSTKQPCPCDAQRNRPFFQRGTQTANGL